MSSPTLPKNDCKSSNTSDMSSSPKSLNTSTTSSYTSSSLNSHKPHEPQNDPSFSKKTKQLKGDLKTPSMVSNTQIPKSTKPTNMSTVSVNKSHPSIEPRKHDHFHTHKRQPSNSNSNTKPSQIKDKKKLVIACIACRKKKIKCSSDRPACSNCLRLNVLCEYPAIRNRGSRFGYMEMLNRRLNHMERYINCSTNPDYQPQFAKIHPKPRVAETELDNASNSDKSSLNNENSQGDSSFNLTDQVKDLDPDTSQPTSSRPSSSRDKSIIDSIELPPLDIILHLVELYFRHVHGQTYSFLHKPTLIPRIYKNQVNKGLVLALCGLTARFSRHPAVASRIPYIAGEAFVSKARRIISMEFDDPSLETVQAMILLVQHDFFRSKGKKSMIYISMAIRMAATLELHQESPDPSLSFLEREQRRRTYWSLVVLDRLGHSASHWQVQLRTDLVSIQMPCTDYCFETCIPVVTQKLNGDWPEPIQLSGAARYPEYPKEKLGIYAYIVKVTILWCDINKYVIEGYRQETTPPWEPGSNFSKLETRLQNLFSEIPEEYQYSRERLIALDTVNQGGALVHLHGELLVSLCYLNRSMYPFNYKNMKFDSSPPTAFIERAAINIMASAKAQSAMIEDVLMMEDFNMAPFVGFGVFALSSVHIANCFSVDDVVSSAAKNNLAINLKFLVIMREYWYSVGVWCIILKDRYFQKASRHSLRMKNSDGGEWTEQSNKVEAGNDLQYCEEYEKDPDTDQAQHCEGFGRNNNDDENKNNRIREQDTKTIPDGFSRPGTPPLAYAPDDFINVKTKKTQIKDLGDGSVPGADSSVARSPRLVKSDNNDVQAQFESDSFDTWPKTNINSNTTKNAAIKSSHCEDLKSILMEDKVLSSLSKTLLNMKNVGNDTNLESQNVSSFSLLSHYELPNSKECTISEQEDTLSTITEEKDFEFEVEVSETSGNPDESLLKSPNDEWLNSIDICDFQQLLSLKGLDDDGTPMEWANNTLFANLINASNNTNNNNIAGNHENNDRDSVLDSIKLVESKPGAFVISHDNQPNLQDYSQQMFEEDCLDEIRKGIDEEGSITPQIFAYENSLSG